MKFNVDEYLKEEEEKRQRQNRGLMPTLDELYEMEMYLYDPDIENAGDRE